VSITKWWGGVINEKERTALARPPRSSCSKVSDDRPVWAEIGSCRRHLSSVAGLPVRRGDNLRSSTRPEAGYPHRKVSPSFRPSHDLRPRKCRGEGSDILRGLGGPGRVLALRRCCLHFPALLTSFCCRFPLAASHLFGERPLLPTQSSLDACWE
jgi:hypothetical protein